MNTRLATRIALLVLSLVVLAAWQQGGTRSTRWEYNCAEVPNNRMRDRLSEAGNNGWEMVGFEQAGNVTMFCFKRPR